MNKLKSMIEAEIHPPHPLHQAIGRVVRQERFPGCDIWKDRACDPDQGHHVTFFNVTGPEQVHLCDVDLIILVPGKATVVIEIEESNVKPLHLFGKFYASAFSTDFNDQDISELPLLFVQVLLEPKRTRKGKQWERIKQILKEHAEKWPGSDLTP